MKFFKVAPDYGTWPTWMRESQEVAWDNVAPEQLPLSSKIVKELLTWDQLYQDTLDHGYPPDSKFRDSKTRDYYFTQGYQLEKKLRSILGDALIEWKNALIE